ncbi:hypothetical protein F441_20147 [Phytophthora nicotianae CJ01A1]|uniref:Uncharacterized protein n=3 Tax=Phytophthora nicotianae TaxID=4792 RepID=V9E245_PHYNI|nr:hypothetical protein F443_20255 [Phytophthora nicotianae P1569]ETO61746.1 hypothetical protein F444_20270 [Phytophthora nicotianae P1976]ETP02814.1 hypothetical protein F441_20147 [Phytophthora nicotianae CJ01A1]
MPCTSVQISYFWAPSREANREPEVSLPPRPSTHVAPVLVLAMNPCVSTTLLPFAAFSACSRSSRGFTSACRYLSSSDLALVGSLTRRSLASTRSTSVRPL